MPRYTYEIEYIPDPPDEAPVGDKTTARMVKSVMTSTVEFQNENQLHAHLRERMKKPGNWKTRFREAPAVGSTETPQAMVEGRKVKLGKNAEELPE
mgnify:FL=1